MGSHSYSLGLVVLYVRKEPRVPVKFSFMGCAVSRPGTYAFPGVHKVLERAVLARRVLAGMNEPCVPDRLELRGVGVVRRIVDPARAPRLLLEVFPVFVAVAV